MIFFFSSRRRHTRSKRDWSSDVCSSDLESRFPLPMHDLELQQRRAWEEEIEILKDGLRELDGTIFLEFERSEERREGKERRRASERSLGMQNVLLLIISESYWFAYKTS